MKRLLTFFLIFFVFNFLQVSASTSDKNNDLLMAATTGDYETVQQLLSDGVDPNVNNGLFTPLIAASINPANLKTALLLIDSGADINATTTNGETALLYAVMSNNQKLITVLLEKGADPDTKSSLSGSPRDMAKMLHQTAILKEMSLSKPLATPVPSNPSSASILLPLTPTNIFLAKEESSNLKNIRDFDKKLGYKLGSKGYPLTYKLRDIEIFLVTPFSAIRYGHYLSNQTFEDFDPSEIIRLKDYSYIWIPQYAGIAHIQGYNAPVKNVVIKKNGVIHKGDQTLLPLNFSTWDLNTNQMWAFPIGLIDGEPFEVIVIDFKNDQKPLLVSPEKFQDIR